MVPSGFIEKQYYKPEYKPNKNFIESSVHVNQFTSAVKFRLQNDNIMAALTGGLDTRATWSVIHSLGKSETITAVTHGMPNCRDISISEKITEILGVRHLIYFLDDDFIRKLPQYWLKLTDLGEGSIPLSSAHALAYWQFCSQFGKIILDSHGGALYRRQYMKFAGHILNKSQRFIDTFFDFISTPIFRSNLLDKSFRNEIENACKKSLTEYFESIDYVESTGAKIDLFYIHQISAFKYSVAANVQQNYIGVHHPFLNAKLFSRIQKIPESFRSKNWLHKKIIETYNSNLESIWLDNMGLPAPYWGFEKFKYLPMLYERSIEKIPKIFYQYFQKLSIKKFVTDYRIFLLKNEKFAREVLLDLNPVFYDFFKKEKVEKHLDLFNRGNTSLADEILQLLGFKLFLDKLS